VAVFADAPGVAGMLLAIAMLTKPQPIFVAPVIVATLGARRGPFMRLLARFTGGGLLTAGVVVAPVVARGAWSNLVQALGRLATHDMLSGQAANIWWLFTYALRVKDVWGEWGPTLAITQRLRILAISRAVALGYPNARAVGLVLVGAAIAAAVWRARRASSLAAAAALTGWTAWAYAVLAAQVHENHIVLAVPLVSLAAGLDARFRPMGWTVSIIAAVNLYLFGGFGLTWPPVDRLATVIDASVLLAVVNVAAFLWFALNKGTGVFSAGPPTDTPSA
jgi:hypothetical protein